MESLVDRITRYSKETYDILVNRYLKNKKTPSYVLYFDWDEFPGDKLKVPACTIYGGDESDRTTYLTEDFNIHYNLPLMVSIFYDYTKLICIHEMCHVFTDVLTKYWGVKQSEYDHAGHPEIFFELMNLFKLTESEKKLQHERHEIPYNYGKSITNFSEITKIKFSIYSI